MKAWKYRPNTYDVNLVKCHDDNSAINIEQLAEELTKLPKNKQRLIVQMLEGFLHAS